MLQRFDERNRNLVVNINGRLVHRDEAGVSPFDSVVQGGDAVWEGLRVYGGRIFRLHQHLDRLHASARALAFERIPTHAQITAEIAKTLRANSMQDGVHIRLTLTRGPKVTSGMSPKWNRSDSCLIVLAEWKAPVYGAGGLRLVTSAIRRNPPQCVDSKIHHNNLINNILAKIEANAAGADDALMLDLDGFVAETNATNVFLVRRGELATPFPRACLPGITRGLVLELARDAGIAAAERDLSLTDVYTADEMFATGTMGELTPVLECDGRRIGAGRPGPLTARLQQLFGKRTARDGDPIPD